MAIVKPKTKIEEPKAEEPEAYKTPGVPEDANRNIPEELEDLFGESLPSETVKEDAVFDNLAKDTKESEPEPEPEPEPEVKADEETAEELPEEKGETPEEVPESGDPDPETAEEEPEAGEETPEETTAEQLARSQEANRLLIAKINDGSYVSAEAEIAAPVETPAQVAQSQVQTPSRLTPVPNLQVSVEDLSDEQFVEIQEDKAAFKTYVQGMIQQGVQSTHLQMNEAINTAMTVREQIGSFFKDDKNKDIMPLHNKVKEEAYKLDAVMPEASVLQVLEKAGEIVREQYKEILDAMSIQKKEIIKTKTEAAKVRAKPKVPRFANTTGRREVAANPKKPSAAEVDMLEMFPDTGPADTDSRYVY